MADLFYFVQRFRPGFEATSKEVDLLFRLNSNTFLHDLHLDGYFRRIFAKNHCSYHFLFYPLFWPLLYLMSRRKITHIYTGLPDSLYLPSLSKRRMVLTATNYFSKSDLVPKLPYLRKVQKIIVQSDLQKEILQSCNLPEDKIAVILPPVELNKFNYHKAKGNFTILNASCPTKVKDLTKRGIFLILGLEQELLKQQVKVTMAWRKNLNETKKVLAGRFYEGNSPFNFIENIRSDMNDEFAAHHCTIISYLQYDPNLKLVPLSVVESLAAGKPVLVSSQTGIAEIVTKEKCGAVFEPTKESLLKAIEDIQKNYFAYQKNCRKTAEKYFSQEIFLKKHEEIYNSIL